MAPLRGRWAEVREQAEKLVEKRDTASGGRARRINNDLSRLLSRFAEEIASVRVLDPACGSGNFLGVSMHRLLNSRRKIIIFSADVGLPSFFPKVGPEQVLGIEPCNREIGRGFFEGVCAPCKASAHLYDPPPTCHPWIA